MYLIKQLVDSKIENAIRLFESFISYKGKGVKSNHIRDVRLVREQIRSSNPVVHPPETLAMDSNDTLENPFPLL